MARLVRGQVLSIKQTEYILASRSIGSVVLLMSLFKLFFQTVFRLSWSVQLCKSKRHFTESFLSFIGLALM